MDDSEFAKILEKLGFQNLSKKEERRFFDLFSTPGWEEFALLPELAGKNPLQIKNILVDEYLRRFNPGYDPDQMKEAIGPCRSWRVLDIAITNIVHSLDNEAEKAFWDRARHVLHALPQRKDSRGKYKDSHELRNYPPQQGWSYVTCKHCWRTVPYNKELYNKTGNLCFEHTIKSTDRDYRKHERLISRMEKEARRVLKDLIIVLPSDLPDNDAREILLQLLTGEKTPLPHLVSYLHDIGHTGEPESLLRAFHGPFTDAMNPLYRDAMEDFIRDVVSLRSAFDSNQLAPYIFTLDELSRAEAWLIVLNSDNRCKTSHNYDRAK